MYSLNHAACTRSWYIKQLSTCFIQGYSYHTQLINSIENIQHDMDQEKNKLTWYFQIFLRHSTQFITNIYLSIVCPTYNGVAISFLLWIPMRLYISRLLRKCNDELLDVLWKEQQCNRNPDLVGLVKAITLSFYIQIDTFYKIFHGFVLLTTPFYFFIDPVSKKATSYKNFIIPSNFTQNYKRLK